MYVKFVCMFDIMWVFTQTKNINIGRLLFEVNLWYFLVQFHFNLFFAFINKQYGFIHLMCYKLSQLILHIKSVLKEVIMQILFQLIHLLLQSSFSNKLLKFRIVNNKWMSWNRICIITSLRTLLICKINWDSL